jgi:hypothetical protein
MTLTPYTEGEFRVASAHNPRWLTTDTQGGIIWCRSYARATVFNFSSFQQMMSENKWLEDADFWFQR